MSAYPGTPEAAKYKLAWLSARRRASYATKAFLAEARAARELETDDGDAAIAVIAEVLSEHSIECTGVGEVTCHGCRQLSWMSWFTYREHVAEAVVVALRRAGQ